MFGVKIAHFFNSKIHSLLSDFRSTFNANLFVNIDYASIMDLHYCIMVHLHKDFQLQHYLLHIIVNICSKKRKKTLHHVNNNKRCTSFLKIKLSQSVL